MRHAIVIIAILISNSNAMAHCDWGSAKKNIDWVVYVDADAKKVFKYWYDGDNNGKHADQAAIFEYFAINNGFYSTLIAQLHNGDAQGSITNCRVEAKSYLSGLGYKLFVDPKLGHEPDPGPDP